MNNVDSISSEPISGRKKAALKNVDVQSSLFEQFAKQYRFTSDDKKGCIESVKNHLNQTFFKSMITDGRTITDYHHAQVAIVAIDTGLNPFNNELYGVFTQFGDLKVIATVDGWMKISTSSALTVREFVYSQETTEVEINGHKYFVPVWIESHLQSSVHGASQSREYFWEVYNNSLNQTVTWSRPARALKNVAFVQAMRKLRRISGLSDSDIMADVDRDYEAMVAKSRPAMSAGANKPSEANKPSTRASTTRKLNIDVEKLEVVDVDVDLNETNTEPATVGNLDNVEPGDASISDVDVIAEQSVVTQDGKGDEQVEGQDIAGELSTPAAQEPQAHDIENGETTLEDLVVNESEVPSDVLMIVKPLLEKVRYGQLPIENVTCLLQAIDDDLGKRWVEQEIKKLS
ncbi:recombinase family protein [Enterovibrio norvegicus]|uniref:hypothetical protein n=1 Tax=Enterovibrio norvegicus TaxID=188144 RepID=UPI000C859F0E|nr:hypothetical protein [Enterovibrio norvegicus]PMH64453.1 hypothetical protein BCU62_15475 [Enterovibrio norvegicus]